MPWPFCGCFCCADEEGTTAPLLHNSRGPSAGNTVGPTTVKLPWSTGTFEVLHNQPLHITERQYFDFAKLQQKHFVTVAMIGAPKSGSSYVMLGCTEGGEKRLPNFYEATGFGVRLSADGSAAWLDRASEPNDPAQAAVLDTLASRFGDVLIVVIADPAETEQFVAYAQSNARRHTSFIVVHNYVAARELPSSLTDGCVASVIRKLPQQSLNAFYFDADGESSSTPRPSSQGSPRLVGLRSPDGSRWRHVFLVNSHTASTPDSQAPVDEGNLRVNAPVFAFMVKMISTVTRTHVPTQFATALNFALFDLAEAHMSDLEDDALSGQTNQSLHQFALGPPVFESDTPDTRLVRANPAGHVVLNPRAWQRLREALPQLNVNGPLDQVDAAWSSFRELLCSELPMPKNRASLMSRVATKWAIVQREVVTPQPSLSSSRRSPSSTSYIGSQEGLCETADAYSFTFEMAGLDQPARRERVVDQIRWHLGVRMEQVQESLQPRVGLRIRGPDRHMVEALTPLHLVNVGGEEIPLLVEFEEPRTIRVTFPVGVIEMRPNAHGVLDSS